MKATAKAKVQTGAILLEDGSFFKGWALGAVATREGEFVFHTGHQGYQEVLTDPSYRKQVLVFSAPQIGNQGFCVDDAESSQVWASGAVMRAYHYSGVQYRAEKSLAELLKENGVPALYGVDTRRLILKLRDRGALWGILSTETSDRKALEKKLKKSTMAGLSLTSEVSTHLAYRWSEPSHSLLPRKMHKKNGGLKRVVVMDFGVKRQILRYLFDAGFQEIIVVPARTTAKEILVLKPDALFLSNGPGDPSAEKDVIAELKKIIFELPTFGICLGHQLLALALGIPTYKLKFGHHGANHPVKNLLTNKVEITSQNHGFAVTHDLAQLSKAGLEITHLNLNDQTVEGFRHKKYPIYAIQFHPESGPGPLDSVAAFEDFQRGWGT